MQVGVRVRSVYLYCKGYEKGESKLSVPVKVPVRVTLDFVPRCFDECFGFSTFCSEGRD